MKRTKCWDCGYEFDIEKNVYNDKIKDKLYTCPDCGQFSYESELILLDNPEEEKQRVLIEKNLMTTEDFE